jgi:hypothetical protein
MNADNVPEIQHRLDQLRCPATSFAAIWEQRSAAWLSLILSGQRSLGGGEAQSIFAMLDKLERLAKFAAPIPVDFSNVIGVKAALRQYLDFRAEEKLLSSKQSVGVNECSRQ